MVTDIWVNLFSYKFLISTFFFPPLCSLNRWRCKANGWARRIASSYFQEMLLLFTTIQYEGYKNETYFLLYSMKFQGTISKLYFSESKNKSWYFCRQMAKYVVFLSASANKGYCSLIACTLFSKLALHLIYRAVLLNNVGSWFQCATFHKGFGI